VAKSDGDHASLFQSAPLPIAKLGYAETLACLRLIRSENVGAVTFRTLINHYGGATRALQALPELSRRGGGKRTIRLCSLEDAEAEMNAAQRAGATPLFTIEPGYPAALAAIDAPPPLLYVKGRIELLNRPSVAIVGSRQCSAAGHKLARLFAAGLSEAGFVVVSGLARGIDGIAHETALEHGTVAVVAGGIDVIYPPEHAALTERIAIEGCLVSEQPPGFKPRAQDFPRRNRIISGMSLGVVIVEAAARSGTLVTARYAGEQGRDVFAVPGHPLDPRAEGTNRLIQQGATLVVSPNDVIELLKPMAGLSETRFGMLMPDAASTLPASAEPLPPEVGEIIHERILQALGPAPVDIDSVVRVTGLTIREVQIAVLELALAGRISRPGPGLVSRL
jgi:DNA processing protein